MKGDGHPPKDSVGSETWDGTDFQPATDPIFTKWTESVQHDPNRTVERTDKEIDELEAKLDQRDADLQHVINRYEAVLENRAASNDTGQRNTSADITSFTRERIEEFLRDLRRILGPR